MEADDTHGNSQKPQEEAAGVVPSLAQDEELEDLPELAEDSDEDTELEDLDLDCLSSYPLAILKRYCKEEGVPVPDVSKESLVGAILKYNDVEPVPNTGITRTTTTTTTQTTKSTPSTEREERQREKERRKRPSRGGAEGRMSAAQFQLKEKRKTKAGGKKKGDKRADHEERLMYSPPSWGRYERGPSSLTQRSEEEMLALAIEESLRESGSPKPERTAPEKRDKREKKKPSRSSSALEEKETEKRSGNRRGGRRSGRDNDGDVKSKPSKKSSARDRKKPEADAKPSRKKTDRTQTAELEIAESRPKEKKSATEPKSTDRESLMRSDEEFAKALHESLNGSVSSDSRLVESIRRQLLHSSDSDEVSSSSETDDDDDIGPIDIDMARRGMLNMLEALGLPVVSPGYGPGIVLPGSSAWSVPPALVPDRTSFINTLIATHQRRIDPDQMSYEELLALQEQIGDVKKKGMTQTAILSNSQTLTFQQVSDDAEKDSCCPICLMEFVEGDEIRKLRCVHIYHKDCIDKWLEHHETCCVCMRPLLEENGNNNNKQ